MTTKDYIYLGLILLTALAFYCNGFYAGVYRCKKVYDTALDEAEAEKDATDVPSPEPGKSVVAHDKALFTPSGSRTPHILLADRDLRGDFRNN
jgi:hypothetical protein